MSSLALLAQADAPEVSALVRRISAPEVDAAALSPLIALTVGAVVVLLLGLARPRFVRGVVVPALTVLAFLATAVLGAWQWDEPGNRSVIEGAMAVDDLTIFLTWLFCLGGIAATLLAVRGRAAEEAGHGEFYALLLASVLGMVVLVGATNLVTVFLGYELLSIPLYVLCATNMRREKSLESGLKYLVIGSVGSATLLYGLALLYGATGSTDFAQIAEASEVFDDALFLTGIAFVVVGFAFKNSIAPFHQWTPDVYEGAPTPVTAFMAVATKAAAFGAFLRFMDVALIGAADTWAPMLAVLAAVTIVVGNLGALRQNSLKRLLAYSSVAQAGYLLAGVVVSTRLGVQATVFYLAVYTVMNLAAFAVIVARERESEHGDGIESVRGLGAWRPMLAIPLTIALLALAGFPATGGFFGKVYLIEALVTEGYTWLGVVIVLGSALSLAYYLKVVVAMWAPLTPRAASGRAGTGTGPGGSIASGGARPAIAGGSPETTPDEVRGALAITDPDGEGVGRGGTPWAVPVAVVCAALTVATGIFPQPLFDLAREAGGALTGLF